MAVLHPHRERADQQVEFRPVAVGIMIRLRQQVQEGQATQVVAREGIQQTDVFGIVESKPEDGNRPERDAGKKIRHPQLVRQPAQIIIESTGLLADQPHARFRLTPGRAARTAYFIRSICRARLMARLSLRW